MIPFRVYNREEKSIWFVLNYHGATDEYLVAKETEDDNDGKLGLVKAKDLAGLHLVDFLDDEEEGY